MYAIDAAGQTFEPPSARRPTDLGALARRITQDADRAITLVLDAGALIAFVDTRLVELLLRSLIEATSRHVESNLTVATAPGGIRLLLEWTAAPGDDHVGPPPWQVWRLARRQGGKAWVDRRGSKVRLDVYLPAQTVRVAMPTACAEPGAAGRDLSRARP